MLHLEDSVVKRKSFEIRDEKPIAVLTLLTLIISIGL